MTTLTHLSRGQQVFSWMLQRLPDAGLVKAKTVGIDATTLEANAALRSIMRRDTGESPEARGKITPAFFHTSTTSCSFLSRAH